MENTKPKERQPNPCKRLWKTLTSKWTAERQHRRDFEMKHGWKPEPDHSVAATLIASATALISVVLVCATAIIIAVILTFPKEVYDVAWTWGSR